MALYDRDDVEAVGLDDAARRLGVERRRIYDIVNVLESVGVSHNFSLSFHGIMTSDFIDVFLRFFSCFS